jgi:phosphatidylserine synthase
LFGIITGPILFFFSELDDAPGLGPIGIVLCFCLIFFGVHNMSKINSKIKAKVIVPLFFGIVGIITVFVLLFNGEFTDSPGVFFIGMALCIGLIFIGSVGVEKIRQKINPGIAVPLFYCVSGIILALVLPFDGEISGSQRIFVIGIILFIGLISISISILIKKLKPSRR